MDKMLYKYTTLESLALILKSKSIRLNPLTVMDDLQETESDDDIKYAQYVFISSWMDQPLESVAMWKLYSNMNRGVRIGLKRKPFKKYTVSRTDIQKKVPAANLDKGNCIELIAPIEQCFNDNYMIVNSAFDQSLEKVEYTDDPALLSPKLFSIEQDRMGLATATMGKYKNTYWEFQNEERYVLRFLPVDAKRMIYCENAKEAVYQAFINTNNSFLPYYDLKIRDDAFNSMEITLSPQFTDGNKILLETLCQKYNPNMKIVESALKNKVRL